MKANYSKNHQSKFTNTAEIQTTVTKSPSINETQNNTLADREKFKSIFYELARKHGTHTVWNDFITIIACVISNLADSRFYMERKQLAIETAKRYTIDEYKNIRNLAVITSAALHENPEQDFLGEMFMELKLNDQKKDRSLRRTFSPH